MPSLNRRQLGKAAVWAAPAVAVAVAHPSVAASTRCSELEPPFSSLVFNTLRPGDPAEIPGSESYVGVQRLARPNRLTGGGQANFHVYQVLWNDAPSMQVLINVNVGNRAQADIQLRRFLDGFGQLPRFLRRVVTEIVVHRGDAAFGGGSGRILGYTDRNTDPTALLGVLFHEAGHSLAHRIDADPGLFDAWVAAQIADDTGDKYLDGYICGNAYNFPQREDLTASLLPWFGLRQYPDRLSPEHRNFIACQIPHRIAFFDARGWSFAPLGGAA